MQRFQLAVRFGCHECPVEWSGGCVLKVVVAALALNAFPLGAVALAGTACDVPVSEWRPREILRARLQADGWEVRSIRAQDGCYEAYGRDRNGVEVHALFDPRTLKRVDTAKRDGAG
jgi:hypothetical protein